MIFKTKYVSRFLVLALLGIFLFGGCSFGLNKTKISDNPVVTLSTKIDKTLTTIQDLLTKIMDRLDQQENDIKLLQLKVRILEEKNGK